MPADPKVRAGVMAATKGALIAWDPIAQQARWRVAFKGPWNGGVLATGGGLVFQGNASRELAAYEAVSGAKPSTSSVQTGITGAPVPNSIEGEQYLPRLAVEAALYAM